jgi:hypothetical protein
MTDDRLDESPVSGAAIHSAGKSSRLEQRLKIRLMFAFCSAEADLMPKKPNEIFHSPAQTGAVFPVPPRHSPLRSGHDARLPRTLAERASNTTAAVMHSYAAGPACPPS